MTDTQSPQPNSGQENEKDGNETPRPDQGGTNRPALDPAKPSTGGEGAAGAGGPKGFGTGT